MIFIDIESKDVTYNSSVIKMLPIYRVSDINKQSWRKGSKPYRRISNETYKQRLIDNDSTYEPLEEYITSSTKIKHRCLICGYINLITPTNALNAKLCPECNKREASLRQSKTHEQFLEETKNVLNPNIEIVGHYINAKTKIECKCKLCGKTLFALPYNLLHGSGCKSCASKLVNSLRRKTNIQFLEEIEDVKNKNMIIIGEYIDSKTKIECLCLLCNKNYWALPSEIEKGRGHRKCSSIISGGKRRLTNEMFLEKMKNINDTIIFLSPYVKNEDKVECQCKICGYIWKALPSNLYKGAGCPKCADIRGSRKRKEGSSQIYIQKIVDMGYELAEDYQGCYIPIFHRCKTCGCKWKVDPHHMLTRGSHCPSCFGSNGEKKIADVLKKYEIEYIPQYRYDDLLGVNGGKLSYDFYLVDYNKVIEFQGLQHEQPIDFFGGEEQFKIQQEHDKRKRNYALDHNIDLLEIWYYDFDNIEQILTNFLNLKTVETVAVA